MKVLIIEDERPAAQKLTRLLKEIDPAVEVVALLRSVEEATNWFLENPSPELVFMDIQLEDGISFEIFENTTIEVPVIFTTAYDEYALKAFKVNSIDYLLKPIDPDELRKALDKFSQLHTPLSHYTKYESIIQQLQPTHKERFLIRVGEHYKSVPVQDIACFYILERNAFLLTGSGKHYPIDYSLDQIERLVDPKRFFRANRNCIVNYDAIEDMIAYSSNRIKLILSHWEENDDILVSRERVADFKQWMDR